jgi:hypothetical protein
VSFGPSVPPVPSIAQPVLPAVTPDPPPSFGTIGPGSKPQTKPSQPSFLGGLTASSGNLSRPSLFGSFGG